MRTTRRQAWQGRRGKRRGNMTVTALCIVLGMMALTAGIHTMLTEQIRQAGAMQSIGLAKLQAYYLAEMGLNQVMFEANQNMTATNPFKVSTTTGQGTLYDFKKNVAMVRNSTAGAATCTVSYQTAVPNVLIRSVTFKVIANLVVPQAGTFVKTVTFSTQQTLTGQPWLLTGYTVLD